MRDFQKRILTIIIFFTIVVTLTTYVQAIGFATSIGTVNNTMGADSTPLTTTDVTTKSGNYYLGLRFFSK